MPRLQLIDKAHGLWGNYRWAGLYGGRAAVKSSSIASFITMEMARKSTRVICLREFQNSISQSSKAVIVGKIKQAGLEDHFDILEREIRGRKPHNRDSLAVFLGARRNPQSIQSFEDADIAWAEEAEHLTQVSLDILLPTLRSDGSRFLASWNPHTRGSPVDNMFRQGAPDPAMWVQEFNWRDNPWLSDAVKYEIKRAMTRDPEKFAWIWDGGYREISEANVFKNWRIGTMELPEKPEYRHGADWGFGPDPTTLIRFLIFPERKLLYVPPGGEVVGYGVPLDKRAELFKKKLPDIAKWPIVGDSAEPATIEYLRRNGLPKLKGAKKGKGSVEAGVAFLEGYDILIAPENKTAIAEFGSYRYKVDRVTQEVLPVLVDDNNHIIDPMRYACEDLIRGGGHEFS